MTITELVNKYEALGAQFWLEGGQLRFRAPAGVLNEHHLSELRGYKENLIEHIKGTYNSFVITDPSNRYTPFPLTDVQAAYLLGREDIYEFGGVGCHGYTELTMPVLDKDRLEKAWHAVIQRHDMLRAVVFKQGYQQVLAETPLPPLRTQDLRGVSPEQAQAAIQKVRAELSTRQYVPDQWPLYELFLTTTDENSILHFSLDMLIADFISINIILTELNHLYYQPEIPLPELAVTYRDLLLFQQSRQKQLFNRSRQERDRQYWLERMDHLPEAPQLPLAEDKDKAAGVAFERYQFYLEKDKWAAICQQAKQKKITPASAVLAAFAEIIGLWARQPDFCINITILNRPELHPQIDQIVGDFTAVNVLEVAPQAGSTFLQRVQALQQRLWLDLEHSSFSGIEVLRELNRRRNKNVIIPVVYTSMIGVGDAGLQEGALLRGAKLTYGISQTPQVWIDCQAAERCGELHLNWDVRSGVFPAGMIEAAFAVFADLLQAMAAGENTWHRQAPLQLPAQVRATRKLINNTAAPIPAGLLQDGFCVRVEHCPDAPALVSEGRQFTYQELADHAVAVQQALMQKGCKKGDRVAVVLEKGLWQIAAVLGILLAGGVYVPIDVSQPQARRTTIMQDSETLFIVTRSEHAGQTGDMPPAFIAVEELKINPDSVIEPVPVDSFEPAYIIYTSGSTGKPKGVVMSHCAVMNTIQDINTRFKVDCRDKILGLANLGFDLSVYDIFGLLTAGGTLILPDAQRQHDASHWQELICRHGITVWNSVPAQMQMLLSYLQSDPSLNKPALRLALLSGDWIPSGLPATLAAQCPGVEGISLGGATEAAIWSIFHPFADVPAEAKRIPYGKPLANQRFYILNDRLQACPDWTVGHIYIGGAGLAQGYSGNEQLTAERFILHPETGERLYDTGDIGRYRPDGVIEFFGREDTQVKIHGHRIELSEIESVLQHHPAVAAALVMVSGDTPQEYRLHAFVEPKRLQQIQPPVPDRVLQDACFQAGQQATKSVDRAMFAQWMKAADQTTLFDIIKTLRDAGLFRAETASHSLEEIQAAVGVIPKLYKLVRRWLQVLCAENLLHKDNTGKYRLLTVPPAQAAEHCWQQLEAIEAKVHYGAKLVSYLRESNKHLPELLRGDVDALALLFPQGNLDTALAAYHDNLVNLALNQVARECVVQLAAERTRSNNSRPLQVLEVGAGVGGTSLELIPALAEYNAEYHFTDISTFFLNEAKNRFEKYPWVTYGLYDINKEYWLQGLEAAKYDVIVCANVLHNARNAPEIIKTLQELAVPGGKLIVIEATKETYTLLTSMEFKDGLTGFTDFRASTDSTFIDFDKWQALFAGANAQVLCAYPAVEDPLAMAGQTVFIIGFPGENLPLYKEEIGEYLQQQLPAYMIPGHIEIMPQLPLSGNGKVDRGALKKRLEVSAVPDHAAGEVAQDDLETRIAGIWAAALNRETIGRNEDFFAAGGDSLLVTQVVAKMREVLPEAKSWEWDRLMREMLGMPTVAAIGRQLRSQKTVTAVTPGSTALKPATPLIILAEGKQPGGAMKVFFHDGTGTLAIYNHILPALINAPDRTETIAGFTLIDEKAYLAIPGDRLIVTLGQQYADLLLRHGACRFELIGHCMGGFIAIETARALMEAGAAIAPVTVIDSNRFPYQIEDELFLERLFGQLVGADMTKAGHSVPDKLMKKALEEIRAAQTGVISTEAWCSLSGPLEVVAQSYRQLAAKPQAQRLAELYSAIPAASGVISGYQPNAVNNLYQLVCHSFRGVTAYDPLPFAGDISAACALDRETHFLSFADSAGGEFWQDIALGDLQLHPVAGHHMSCMEPPFAAAVVELLTKGAKG